jgi:hypothetical protein
LTAVQERLYDDTQMVYLNDLRLDPKNVRFRHKTSIMSENEMEEWLYNEEDVRVLMKQILRDRRVQQPIYVIEDGNGKYIVKEGNRRTTALRRIQRELIKGKIKDFDKDHFDLVPTNILKGNEHEINIFLAQIHVSGAKEWDAVNKGALIYDLMEKSGDTLESVAEELGMTKGRVDNYYRAFKATEMYGKRFPQDRNYVPKFSYFAELFQSKVLRTWIEEDPSKMDYFMELVQQNKLLVTYRGVRSLAKIIAAPITLQSKALAILNRDDGDIDKATEVIQKKTLSPKSLWGIMTKLSKCETSYEEFDEAVQDKEKLQMLDNTMSMLSGIRENIVQLQSKTEMTS